MVNTNRPQVNKKKLGGAIGVGIVILLIIILFFTFSPFVTVPAGHTGVVVTMGKVSDDVLSEGMHFKLPWQTVILIDNRAQKAPLDTQAFSSDIQQVNVSCSVNYSVDRATSQNLYKNVGIDYYSKVMLPRVMENVKAVFSKYTADNLIDARDSLSVQIQEKLAPEMKAYGINVLSIAIEDVDFSDTFTEAVEAKQVAEQTKKKTEIEQDSLLVVEQTTADRALITAKANAEVLKIDADAKAYAKSTQAEAEAKANKLIAESVTQTLINYVQANNWNGELPQFVSGESQMLPVINMESEKP